MVSVGELEKQQEKFLDKALQGYPGAAMVIAGTGAVLAANAKGNAFATLIAQSKLDAIINGVEDALNSGVVAVQNMVLDSGQGSISLEATFLPRNDQAKNNKYTSCLVLIRDLTMEQNLRSVLVESRQRYKDLVEVSSDFAWEVDTKGVFQFVSPKGVLGFKADDIVGKEARRLVVDAEFYNPVPFISKKPLGNVEMWLTVHDDTTACVLVSCEPLFDKNQVWTGTRGVCRDVTEERANEAALARARHREYLLNHIVFAIRDEIDPLNMLSVAASATAEAVMASGARIYRPDADGVFHVYAQCGKTKGLKSLEALFDGQAIDTLTKDTIVGNWQVLYAPTLYRKKINGFFAVWRSVNKNVWEADHRLLLEDVANQLGIANEQIANHERIVALSRTDSLTGLLNRRAFFEEELPRRISRLQRENSTAALFYIDMDNFKLVNDVHGHKIGDDAILMLRQLMLENSRPGDVSARFGGDEFALWLDNISKRTAMKRARAFLKASEKLHQFSGSQDQPLGVSIGVAMYDPAEQEDLDGLISRADVAMYEVKRDGKSGIRMAKPFGALPAADKSG